MADSVGVDGEVGVLVNALACRGTNHQAEYALAQLADYAAPIGQSKRIDRECCAANPPYNLSALRVG
jgi:hypothetical protein